MKNKTFFLVFIVMNILCMSINAQTQLTEKEDKIIDELILNNNLSDYTGIKNLLTGRFIRYFKDLALSESDKKIITDSFKEKFNNDQISYMIKKEISGYEIVDIKVLSREKLPKKMYDPNNYKFVPIEIYLKITLENKSILDKKFTFVYEIDIVNKQFIECGIL